jgi:hypothetical protein
MWGMSAGESLHPTSGVLEMNQVGAEDREEEQEIAW